MLGKYASKCQMQEKQGEEKSLHSPVSKHRKGVWVAIMEKKTLDYVGFTLIHNH